ncbi:MAG: DUF1853 family protein [Psychrobacter sp.]|nr:DUF1853 family protein [Psychrobacter sp.]
MSVPILANPTHLGNDLSPRADPDTLAPLDIPSTPWEHYQRPFVRDLAYALACPPILTTWVNHQPLLNAPTVILHSAEFWQQQFASYQPRLHELDNTQGYQALTRFLMTRPSPYRLGFHFEGLIHFWLIDGFALNLHPFEVLAHNVQLYQGKQTTGELDYILRNHDTGEIEHWELAIKFFLGSPPYTFADWVGMNSRDNLERKMTHMQSKQFRSIWVDVSGHESGKAKVKIDKRIAVIKGRFFKPVTDNGFVRPQWLTPNFPLHDWINGEDTEQLNKLDMSILRRAHYVEWFTKRPFYDERPSPLHWSKDSPPETGLYFEGNRPLVIYRDKSSDK